MLEVHDLTVEFNTGTRCIRAVDGVGFSVPRGRSVAMVGESGCGKSVTALSIMGLLPRPAANVVRGSIRHDGRDLLSSTEAELRQLRGRRISMVFQEPMTSLNPVFRVGDQVAEAIRAHERVSRREAAERAVTMLTQVGISDAGTRARLHPHQLSGGMRQRVMIAMALCCGPELLIADEPTTALDVTVQAQILELLREMQTRLGMGVLLITHDLGVVAEAAEDVLVMYAGVVVERGAVSAVLRAPRHPYTRGLLDSVPARHVEGTARLRTIPGNVPDLSQLPTGCRFRDRCDRAQPHCEQEPPALEEHAPGHLVRCHFPVVERGVPS
ncbi:MAG: ABC transporter ATP-binding protein [Myxococcota bacterium]